MPRLQSTVNLDSYSNAICFHPSLHAYFLFWGHEDLLPPDELKKRFNFKSVSLSCQDSIGGLKVLCISNLLLGGDLMLQLTSQVFETNMCGV